MHLECGGEVEWSSEQVALAEKNKPQKVYADHPWPELYEHELDLRVAERMGKGATIDDARDRPMIEWCELLISAGAHSEALPAQMERAQEEAERKRVEQAQAKEAAGIAG